MHHFSCHHFIWVLLFILLEIISLQAASPNSCENLMNDLLVVDYWNRRLNEKMPVTYNHLYQGGYFAMPSARMGADGDLGIGYAYVEPYRLYNFRAQVLDRLEITGNYRIFHGLEDPILSPHGFGDMSDKGANFKFSLFSPEESGYQWPGLSFGIEDFIGTRGFHARYVVLTHVFLPYHLEISLGYGVKRIRGFFGGCSWIPFSNTEWKWLDSFCVTAEYDATPYKCEKIEKHPHGREKRSPINFGFKYRLWDFLDLSVSYMRGKTISCFAGASYNFGYTTGFLPKIDNVLPYKSPVNFEALGSLRPQQTFVSELVFAFQEQGLTLLDIHLFYNECNEKSLRLNVLNETYRLECEVRSRLNGLLAALMPSDIAQVNVVINSEGFPIQEYVFMMEAVRAFEDKQIGFYELDVLTKEREVTYPDPYASAHLFSRRRHLYNIEIAPNTRTLFGSSSGKFKYALGLNCAFNGFLRGDVYYQIVVGSNFISNIGHIQSIDRLNPSQLIHVRSDIVKYYCHRGVSLTQAYLQKNWNLGRGLYARVAAGYFEVEYGGAAAEFLYYPVTSPWAIGIEGAVLKKRTYTGLGFTDKVRKLTGFIPSYRKFLGSQMLVNLYYDFKPAHLDFKISVGKFLANDWGVRNEISRYFPSGLRLTIWYTLTNGHDKINGKTYYDKGVCISMPFDIFYTYSERSRWDYGLSAWLRDVGVQAMTGDHLYELIDDQRQ